MTYVRWRSRMVRESVWQDVISTLNRTGWLGSDTMNILTMPIILEQAYAEEMLYQGQAPKPNTFSMDNGRPGPIDEEEVGGMQVRPYQFGLTFFAESDVVGLSMLEDLRDRYDGLTDSPFISLYDYNTDPDEIVVRMEALSFGYALAPEQLASKHLYFAELIVQDFVDQTDRQI